MITLLRVMQIVKCTRNRINGATVGGRYVICKIYVHVRIRKLLEFMSVIGRGSREIRLGKTVLVRVKG